MYNISFFLGANKLHTAPSPKAEYHWSLILTPKSIFVLCTSFLLCNTNSQKYANRYILFVGICKQECLNSLQNYKLQSLARPNGMAWEHLSPCDVICFTQGS